MIAFTDHMSGGQVVLCVPIGLGFGSQFPNRTISGLNYRLLWRTMRPLKHFALVRAALAIAAL